MCVTCLRVRDEVLQGALAAPGLAPPLNALTAATAATAASLRFFRRREDSGVASVPATEGVPACAAAAAAEKGAQPSSEQHAGETAPLRVIAGTYGCRQGLSMDATCGPFVHMLDL